MTRFLYSIAGNRDRVPDSLGTRKLCLLAGPAPGPWPEESRRQVNGEILRRQPSDEAPQDDKKESFVKERTTAHGTVTRCTSIAGNE